MPPTSGFEFDDSLWPLLIVRFSGNPTRAELETYLAKRLEYMQRHERHVLLYDTREARMLSHVLMQRHAEWLREHESLRRETVLASAVIITAPIIRLTASAILHVWPVRSPYHFTATLPEAAHWAAERLREAGHPITAQRIHQRFTLDPPGSPDA
jgi:hypothetical protein